MRRPIAALFLCSLVAGCGGTATGSINPPAPPPGSTNLSLQFFGTNAGDVDRVKIQLLENGASRPVNALGAPDLTDGFTLEFWIKGNKADNPTPACTSGVSLATDFWMGGAVVIDRDVLGNGDFGEYGVSLFDGRVAFGVSRGTGGQTVCGARDVLDGASWHHVLLTRHVSTGQLTIFIDGTQDAAVSNVASSGDVSYNPAHPNPAPDDPVLVLGAQKNDRTGAVVGARSFKGLIDELRLSRGLRHVGSFLPQQAAYDVDADTLALYHFDEAAGTAILDAANESPGELVPADPTNPGAHRSTDVPF